MFEVTVRSKNRLDIEYNKKLDAESMKMAIDDLISKCSHIENGSILYRITDFELPTLGAFVVELSRLPKLLKLMGNFKRIAVLADKDWIRKASEIEGILLPFLQIKSFELEQSTEAESWLNQEL